MEFWSDDHGLVSCGFGNRNMRNGLGEDSHRFHLLIEPEARYKITKHDETSNCLMVVANFSEHFCLDIISCANDELDAKYIRQVGKDRQRTSIFKSLLAWFATRRVTETANSADRLVVIQVGLRAKEIASLKWAMCMDANGDISDHIALTNKQAKETAEE